MSIPGVDRPAKRLWCYDAQLTVAGEMSCSIGSLTFS
jgi:hypothetical protein